MVDAPGTQRRGGLSLPTLLIASAAATAAALITSKLWAHGAILSTAITPLIVAIVSELLHRPADRVAQFRAESREAPMAEAVPPRSGRAAPGKRVHVHARGRVHLKPALATGAAAFAIAAAALTLAELIFGGAVATNQGTTLFGGGASKRTNPSAVQQHPTTTRAGTTTQTTGTTARTTTTSPRSTTTPPRTTGTTTPTTTTAPPSTTQGTTTTPPATTSPPATTTPAPAG